MALERTFSIIKPDATKRNLTGAVNAVIEKAGLRIVAQKRIHMTREQAETFTGPVPAISACPISTRAMTPPRFFLQPRPVPAITGGDCAGTFKKPAKT